MRDYSSAFESYQRWKGEAELLTAHHHFSCFGPESCYFLDPLRSSSPTPLRSSSQTPLRSSSTKTPLAKMPETRTIWLPTVIDRINISQIQRGGRKIVVIGIAGPPGCGKSTAALELQRLCEGELGARVFNIGLDGYHLPLSEVRRQDEAAGNDWENSLEYRRGCIETFANPDDNLVEKLAAVKEGSSHSVSFPTFDHAKGDPEENGAKYELSITGNISEVIIVEGLYLLTPAFGNVADLLDLAFFMDTPLEVCMERVRERNKCLPGYTVEEINVRVEKVDRVNAEYVIENSKKTGDALIIV